MLPNKVLGNYKPLTRVVLNYSVCLWVYPVALHKVSVFLGHTPVSTQHTALRSSKAGWGMDPFCWVVVQGNEGMKKTFRNRGGNPTGGNSSTQAWDRWNQTRHVEGLARNCVEPKDWYKPGRKKAGWPCTDSRAELSPTTGGRGMKEAGDGLASLKGLAWILSGCGGALT